MVSPLGPDEVTFKQLLDLANPTSVFFWRDAATPDVIAVVSREIDNGEERWYVVNRLDGHVSWSEHDSQESAERKAITVADKWFAHGVADIVSRSVLWYRLTGLMHRHAAQAVARHIADSLPHAVSAHRSGARTMFAHRYGLTNSEAQQLFGDRG